MALHRDGLTLAILSFWTAGPALAEDIACRFDQTRTVIVTAGAKVKVNFTNQR
jgi:hypothetical protein